MISDLFFSIPEFSETTKFRASHITELLAEEIQAIVIPRLVLLCTHIVKEYSIILLFLILQKKSNNKNKSILNKKIFYKINAMLKFIFILL